MVGEMGKLGNIGMKKDTVPKSVNKRTLPENCKGASRKGIPNKVTKQLKEMILGALDDAGGQAYLARQAEENPGPFLGLIGKVLPTTLVGANGGAIKTASVITVARDLTDAELATELAAYGIKQP